MTGPKLLLVEDDIFIGMDMAHTLSESGYDPVHAKSLDEAEHAIDTNEFAAILLDFRVGSEDTIHFARKLRGLGQRVMFCTGSSPNDLQQLIGDVPVVGKPFTEQQLLEAVASLVRPDGKFAVGA
jgi:DNA-binding response OmpR family regulator